MFKISRSIPFVNNPGILSPGNIKRGGFLIVILILLLLDYSPSWRTEGPLKQNYLSQFTNTSALWADRFRKLIRDGLLLDFINSFNIYCALGQWNGLKLKGPYLNRLCLIRYPEVPFSFYLALFLGRTTLTSLADQISYRYALIF